MSQAGALHVRRRRLLLALLLVVGAGLLGRSFQLQVLQATEWSDRAERQQRDQVDLPAERGTIYDRNGVPLATTREMVRVAIAPHEVADRDDLAERLRSTLGLDRTGVRRALDRQRRWVVLPGLHEPAVRQSLESVDGVYIERVLQRFLPHGDLALELLGRTGADGRALGGLELELDSLLRGEDGTAVLRRDALGEPIPGALFPVEEPRPGRDVYLTLDLGLQEIAQGALRAAVAEHQAEGGDLIFADPRTGEVLAAASVRTTGPRHWRGATDPYEPGSTMKPFIMAALLEHGRVSLGDSVFAEQGYYRAGGRTITDVHGYGWLTAAEVLRYSSNIGMVKLADRLTPAEQYQVLRDLGFGTPTGVGYPSESGGRLNRPADWSGYSQSSLAMGYEISVTPLQMTMAYGALANGGRLMEPRIVREVRSPDGKLHHRKDSREVRRALNPSAVSQVAEVLVDVVQEGTGRRAGLGQFNVAGKTGTARVFSDGKYRRDAYAASFAGFFPARDPQLVFLVKLDRGSGYGGAVAAPVTRATLAAALAARSTPLDRRAVAATAPARAPTTLASLNLPGRGRWAAPVPGPFVFAVGEAAPAARDVRQGGNHSRLESAGQPIRSSAVTVPDVVGEPARDAAAELHSRGFKVRLTGAGQVQAMRPAPGAATTRGTVVHLTLGGAR